MQLQDDMKLIANQSSTLKLEKSSSEALNFHYSGKDLCQP